MDKQKNLKQTSFYFLRHGQTDHNLFKIYDDFTDVAINETGIVQASQVSSILEALDIRTVCSSPLKRVQQTKEHALKNKAFHDVLIDELKECSGDLWKLFLKDKNQPFTQSEEVFIDSFFKQTFLGLEKALSYEGPVLIIAHGGTFLAMHKLLNVLGDPSIHNCELAHFSYSDNKGWEVVKLQHV